MPEGDTIATLAQQLNTVLAGDTLRAIEVLRPFRWRRKDCVVREVHSLGKRLLIELDSGHTVQSHLGMRGRWRTYPLYKVTAATRHRAHLILSNRDYAFVCTNAKDVGVFEPDGDQLRRRDFALRVGPDLTRQCDLDDVVQRVRGTLAPDALMMDVLLNQQVASGIGNVFKSELLFVEGKPVTCRLGDIDDAELRRFYAQANVWLQANVGPGRRRTRDSGGDRRAARLWVYDRAGRPCLRCQTIVASALLGKDARRTYWCPACQAS